MSTIKIIFDNGGGVTLQLETDAQEKFAAYYANPSMAADDVLAFLANDDLSGWEGNDVDAADLNPTVEQVRNGGYRAWICAIDSLDEIREAVTQMEQAGWGNADEFCAQIRKSEAFARIEL